jgi:hypothetical protein
VCVCVCVRCDRSRACICLAVCASAASAGSLEEVTAVLSAVQTQCTAFFASLRHAIGVRASADATTLAESKQEIVDVKYVTAWGYRLSVCLSVRLSVLLSVCLSVCPTLYLAFCLCVMSVCSIVRQPTNLLVCVCLPVRLCRLWRGEALHLTLVRCPYTFI